jgi:hypothetical protein
MIETEVYPIGTSPSMMPRVEELLDLRTAVEFRAEWPTVSNAKGLPTLRESPFWSDAEQCKVLPGAPLGAL